MIGEILPRGSSVRGLVYYLFTEGQVGEKGLAAAHTDPRVIACWDGDGAGLQPPVCGGGRRDFTALVSRLSEPVQALGFSKVELKKVKPVYHLSIAAAKQPGTGELVDPMLSDEQWADIAREYMDRIGLARRDDDGGVRWVAIRHADDHVHVVATLARQDGRRVFPHNDRYRSREASLVVEARYGLRATSTGDRTGPVGTSRAETRKHQAAAARRRAAGLPGPVAPDREVLRRQVRTAAAGAVSLTDFFDRLRADGLLVRERFSERNPGEITGYAVALPGSSDSSGASIFFGGGKLAPDLTVPRLLRRWQDPAGAGGEGSARVAGGRPAGRPDRHDVPGGEADRFGLTVDERTGLWQRATDAARAATDHITACAATDPAAAADAAWAASDFLAAAGRVAEGRHGGPLTAAAETYDRAARDLFGRSPQPTAAGSGLRAAGRLLLAAHVAKASETKQLLALLAQLAALTDAVTRLRETQQRAAQAAAARAAAEQLRAAAGRYGTTTPNSAASAERQSQTKRAARPSSPRAWPPAATASRLRRRGPGPGTRAGSRPG